MYGDSSTAFSACSGGSATDTATTSGRGTITSAASLSPKTKTLSIICCSSCSISPSALERERSMRSSASESGSRSAPGGSRPSRCSTASVALRKIQISGAVSAKNARTGADTQSAVPSACPSASPFGTSSPITTWTKVRSRYARMTASKVAM